MKYRPDIDGLRAIAVSVVVLFHAFPPLMPGGFIGVDIFFVISGYLITNIILKDITTGTFRFRNFYVRRINRIFPPLSAVLLFCGVFGWFVLLSDELRQMAGHLRDASVFLSNFRLLRESGYFDTAAETKPLLHLWSLAIEEQFYLTWPLLLWIFRKNKRAKQALVIGIGIVSLGICLYLTHQQSPGAFYLLQSRFWELAAGGMLALVHTRHSFRNLNSFFSFLGLALIGAGLCTIDKTKAFPGMWAALPVLGSVLIIAAGENAWINKRVLSHPIFVGVGLISYAIYLWHWPLLTFARIIEGETPTIGIRVAVVVLTVVLSYLSYHFLERPIRKSPNVRLKPILLCAVIVTIGLSGQYMYRNAEKISPNKIADFDWGLITTDLCLKTYPFNTAGYSWWFCAANSPKPPNILVVGNSFGNHIYAGLANEPRLSGQSVLSIGTCFPVSNVGYRATSLHPCSGNRPAEQERFVNSIVDKSPDLKLVIFSAEWPSFNERGEAKDPLGDVVNSSDQYVYGNGEANQSSLEAFMRGLDERISYFESKNIPAVLFLSPPRLTIDIRKCISRPLRRAIDPCIESKDIQLQSQKNFRIAIEELKKSHPKLGIFDPLITICDDEDCHYKRNDRLIFRDSDGHYSVYGSNLIISAFVDWAEKNVRF